MNHSLLQKNLKINSNICYLGVFSSFLISFIFIFNIPLMAQGVINVSPKRAVFEGQKRIIEVNLTNDGQDSAKYTISFLQLRMTEDGKIEEIINPDPGQNYADKNIRFYPRSVMLGPNESQVVRLQLTKSDQLQNGEYRSHLYFKSMTPQKILGEALPNKDSVVSLSIRPIFGVTIPVIIRVGISDTKINITDLKFETIADGSQRLHFVINRTGNMSVYGDISVLHIAPNGKETKISP